MVNRWVNGYLDSDIIYLPFLKKKYNYIIMCFFVLLETFLLLLISISLPIDYTGTSVKMGTFS